MSPISQSLLLHFLTLFLYSTLSSQLLYDTSKLLPSPVPIMPATLSDACKCGCVTERQTDRDMVTLPRYSQNDNGI